jgi:tyrosyl-tRNA synthetase
MLTFLPMEQIKEMETWEDSRINEKKEVLAYELTQLVHGTEEADKAKASAYALFSGAGDSDNMPTTELNAQDLTDGVINIANLVVKCGLCASKGEAKRLIQQGGISVNDEVVSGLDKTYTTDDLKDGLKIRKGKKVFHKAILK